MATLHPQRCHIEILRSGNRSRNWPKRGHNGDGKLQNARHPNLHPENFQLFLHRGFHPRKLNETGRTRFRTLPQRQMESTRRGDRCTIGGRDHIGGIKIEHNSDQSDSVAGDASDANRARIEIVEDGEGDSGVIGYGDAGVAASRKFGIVVFSVVLHFCGVGRGTVWEA